MTDENEKEKKRKKQLKKMTKLLAKAWEWDNPTQAFQDFQLGGNNTAVLSLVQVGQKVDQELYKPGKHGWEDFSKEMGGVYNYHIQVGKTKHAALAKKHLAQLQELLSAISPQLATAAFNHVPTIKTQSSSGSTEASAARKRKKAPTGGGGESKKSKVSHHSNKNSELAEREVRAMEMLQTFVQEHGGDSRVVEGYRARVTRKASDGKFDTNFFNESGRRFRSMREVGRFLRLNVDAAGGGGASRARSKVKRKATSRESEAEKKRLRKELERLRKSLQRATKSLDDLMTNHPTTGQGGEQDGAQSVDKKESLLSEEEQSAMIPMPTHAAAAAARIPDIQGFAGIPQHCVPDVLMTWDFLCTFQRALSLTPIASLDDFASALVYMPPEGQLGDDVVVPPVYLCEVHLALLKFLLQDKSSEQWWWCVLENDSDDPTGGGADVDGDFDNVALDEENNVKSSTETKPCIKIDMAALLAEVEDPLITTSWLRTLEDAKKGAGTSVKDTIKMALKVVSNKWVAAYLRKTLAVLRANGVKMAQRAVLWLLDRVRQARPELLDRSVSKEAVFQARAKVVEGTSKEMEALPSSAPTVADDDVVSDAEDDDDESDEESDDEEDAANHKKRQKDASKDDSERLASVIPPKPLPTLVDMLLPPSKPHHNDEFISAFTWPHLVGATAKRVVHRKKRILNEIDESLRASRQRPQLVVSDRRARERMVTSRILTECGDSAEEPSLTEQAIEHLCTGGSYIELAPVQRLCILRILIEAAYDAFRVHDVVSGNIKQRTGAMKALENEQRRAKKEAKEKATADETAAREQLAEEAREAFMDEKREEIRKLNEKSKELSDDVVESLTEEDILDFDDDIRADYDALPGPETFSKTEVTKMVARMQEEAAFEADAVRVLTMDLLYEREQRQLEEMEGQLLGFGGEDALVDSSLDRETVRSIERLQRDVIKARTQAERLPELRTQAIDQLKDAIADGTIKALRSAINAAKKAKLTGPDDETGGVWTIDLLRDAALELEKAKQNKRVFDAQKDLVAKRNKCFIRTEPLGRDRFANRFWTFDHDEGGHIWVEVEYTLTSSDARSVDTKPPPGFLDLSRRPEEISVGGRDMEEDIIDADKKKDFEAFSRREYHSAAFAPTLAKHHWGCHATEESLRRVIKGLDGRGVSEDDLKTKLKDALEEAVGGEEKQDQGTEVAPAADDEEQAVDTRDANPEGHDILTTGDEEHFQTAKKSLISTEDGVAEILDSKSTAIHEQVRIRHVVEQHKDQQVARYENGRVTGWKIRYDEVQVERDDNDDDDEQDEPEPQTKTVPVPTWRVHTDRGHLFWLTGTEVVESIVRFAKTKTGGGGYFEHDAAFFSYRNTLGRYCGKAADAPYASSPIFFARLMVKKEGELYPKLKIRSYDNNWGGKSGARALWTNSMKDFAYDFETVRQGLLTLENAFFELTGAFTEYGKMDDVDDNEVQALLDDPAARMEIELESIEKSVRGLWNNSTSRRVFLHIVSTSTTTGFLALALDLLCRNTTKYLQAHKLLNVRTTEASNAYTNAYDNIPSSDYQALPARRTRRANVNYEEWF